MSMQEPTIDEEFAKEMEQAFNDESEPTPAGASEEAPKPVETPPASETPEEAPTPTTPETPKEEEAPAPTAAELEAQAANQPAAEVPKPSEVVTPTNPEENTPAPLTKEDLRTIINDVRTEERDSVKELDVATQDIIEAYHPQGLSNVLVDDKTGREIKTPQDVVEIVQANGGQMSLENAAQWLINEQHRVDSDVAAIRSSARKVAETTLNFKRDAVAAVRKYEPLFKEYPHLQTKAFDLMMKQVKADPAKNAILEAPDVIELYDTYLEPYQQAFEFAQQKPATNPTPAPAAPAEPPKPTLDDRMDITGDGGSSAPKDPNDFAGAVVDELNKPY